jgi:chromosome transmission fidelity protein 4
LKLFVATVDAGKVERALDLVDRLHLEKSYDLAIQLADHHRKLADLIEDAKERKFAEEDEEEYEDTASPSNTFFDRLAPSRQISPDASQTLKNKRSMGHPEKSTVKKVRLG